MRRRPRSSGVSVIKRASPCSCPSPARLPARYRGLWAGGPGRRAPAWRVMSIASDAAASPKAVRMERVVRDIFSALCSEGVLAQQND